MASNKRFQIGIRLMDGSYSVTSRIARSRAEAVACVTAALKSYPGAVIESVRQIAI